MFEEYSCGCILSRFQGRVRLCVGHRNLIEQSTSVFGVVTWTVKRFWPEGRVVRRYPANGEMPKDWSGR